MNNTTQQDLNFWLERLSANDPLALNAFLERCQGQLRALTEKIFHGFPRLRGLEDPSDVLQAAEIRLVRWLKKAPPDSVDDFFHMAAWEIRCVCLNLKSHYFGPQGAAARQFTGGANWRRRPAAAANGAQSRRLQRRSA